MSYMDARTYMSEAEFGQFTGGELKSSGYPEGGVLSARIWWGGRQARRQRPPDRFGLTYYMYGASPLQSHESRVRQHTCQRRAAANGIRARRGVRAAPAALVPRSSLAISGLDRDVECGPRHAAIQL